MVEKLEDQLLNLESLEFLRLGDPIAHFIEKSDLETIDILLKKRCPLNPNNLFKSKFFGIFEFLLENYIDILDINFDDSAIEYKHKQWIMYVVKNTRMRHPFNPNTLVGKDNLPLWWYLVDVPRSYLTPDFISYKGPNFTEPIDIDVRDKKGRTWLHTAGHIHIDILDMLPNPFARSSSELGTLPSQYRRLAKSAARVGLNEDDQLVEEYESFFNDISITKIIMDAESVLSQNRKLKRKLEQIEVPEPRKRAKK